MGSVTIQQAIINEYIYISTHTLREERDYELVVFGDLFRISTHTLRGERDAPFGVLFSYKKYFNSHAPWGA